MDGDTSTNDTVLCFATGAAGNAAIADADDPRLDGFRAALDAVLVDLATQVVRDGEGATKFVTVTVDRRRRATPPPGPSPWPSPTRRW